MKLIKRAIKSLAFAAVVLSMAPGLADVDVTRISAIVRF